MSSEDSVSDGGITEERLAALVARFYARVRRDPLIGPVFDGAVHDWPEHLEKLAAFWSSVVLGSGRYKGRPLPAHARHADAITPQAFARWLALWREVTDEMMPAGVAAVLQDKAARIAESLALGIEFAREGRLRQVDAARAD